MHHHDGGGRHTHRARWASIYRTTCLATGGPTYATSGRARSFCRTSPEPTTTSRLRLYRAEGSAGFRTSRHVRHELSTRQRKPNRERAGIRQWGERKRDGRAGMAEERAEGREGEGREWRSRRKGRQRRAGRTAANWPRHMR